MVARDYLRLVERQFPVAFARCCSCGQSRATNASLPCYALSDLWSSCFVAHASPGALAAFLVEQLGIFGIFGNEMDRVPESVLRADERLSWVVNNAYLWKGAKGFQHGGLGSPSRSHHPVKNAGHATR